MATLTSLMNDLETTVSRIGISRILAIALVIAIAIHYLRNILAPGLRSLPGPWLAHITSLYRIKLVWKGGAVRNYSALHRKYGPIVRTGSNHISVADPSAVPLIYGISSKFTKVGNTSELNLLTPILTGQPVYVLQVVSTVL